jgi:peptidoglycan/LPS O-acetylase OafA/YrhL
MKDIKELTGLRFLAALYVFIFHLFSHQLLPAISGRVGNIISQGALGVNVFFVLSGFVLAYSHLKDFPEGKWRGWQYAGQFMLKRLARLYPAYLVGLLAYMTIRAFSHELTLYRIIVAGLNGVMMQSLWPAISMEWYGSMAWSISVEIFFYLLFPLLFPVLLAVGKRTLLAIMAGTFLLSFLPGLIYNQHPEHFTAFILVYTFPLLRLPEFVIGIILCILIQRFSWRLPAWVAVLSVLATATYLGEGGAGLRGYVAHNWIVIPTIMAVISTVCSNKSVWFSWLGSPPLVYLGKISYSFYIVQIPLMLLVEKMVLQQYDLQGNILSLTAVFVANLVGAIVLHKLVENPMQRFITSHLKKAPTSFALRWSQIRRYPIIPMLPGTK